MDSTLIISLCLILLIAIIIYFVMHHRIIKKYQQTLEALENNKELERNLRTELKELQKTSKISKGSLYGIPNYDWALLQGPKRKEKCYLILTEGLSAKNFVVSGINVIGREKYGIFPLKGKLLNVRKATVKELKKNKEILYIMQIMGLKIGKKYEKNVGDRALHLIRYA